MEPSEIAMNEPDWSSVDPAIAKEISRLGEVRTAASLTMTIAALQRAMTFASITATATTATLGAAIASAAGSPTFAGLTYPAFVAAGFFWVSCILSVIQARPMDFHAPGMHPRILFGSAEYLGGPLSQSHGWDAENYQHAIDNNEACLQRNGRHMMTAIYFAAGAPAAAFLTWVAVKAWEAWAVAVAVVLPPGSLS